MQLLIVLFHLDLLSRLLWLLLLLHSLGERGRRRKEWKKVHVSKEGWMDFSYGEVKTNAQSSSTFFWPLWPRTLLKVKSFFATVGGGGGTSSFFSWMCCRCGKRHRGSSFFRPPIACREIGSLFNPSVTRRFLSLPMFFCLSVSNLCVRHSSPIILALHDTKHNKTTFFAHPPPHALFYSHLLLLSGNNRLSLSLPLSHRKKCNFPRRPWFFPLSLSSAQWTVSEKDRLHPPKNLGANFFWWCKEREGEKSAASVVCKMNASFLRSSSCDEDLQKEEDASRQMAVKSFLFHRFYNTIPEWKVSSILFFSLLLFLLLVFVVVDVVDLNRHWLLSRVSVVATSWPTTEKSQCFFCSGLWKQRDRRQPQRGQEKDVKNS